MVFLRAGRRSSDLFLGLHDADALQSALLFVSALLRIRPACLCFDVLLRGHFPVHRTLVQGDDSNDYDQSRKVAVQHGHNVVPQTAQANGRSYSYDPFITGRALLHGLDTLRHRQFDRPVRSS